MHGLTLSFCPLQVQFCQQWADLVLTSKRAMRRRRPPSLCIMNTGSSNSAELCTPANARIARLTEHELVDVGMAVRKAEAGKRGRSRKTSALTIPKGVCHYDQCPLKVNKVYKGPLPKLSHFRCQSCKGGVGAYHVECFFHVHRCVIE